MSNQKSVFAGSEKATPKGTSVFVGQDTPPSSSTQPQGASSMFVGEGKSKRDGALGSSVFLAKFGPDDQPGEAVKVPITKTGTPSPASGQLVTIESSSAVLRRQQQQEEGKSQRGSGSRPIKEKLSDTSSFDSNQKLCDAMHNIYIWIAACLMAFWLAGKLSSSIFGGTVTGGSFAFVVVVVVAPLVAIHYAQPAADIQQDNCQLIVLGVAIVQGLLFGILFSDRNTEFYSPPPFAVALSIGLTLRNLGADFAKKGRLMLLGLLLAPAFAFYILYALATQSLTGAYYMWTMTLLAAGASDLQLKLANYRDGNESLIVEYLTSLLTFVAAFSFNACVFSVPEKAQN